MNILVVDNMISIRHLVMIILRSISFDKLDEAIDSIQTLKLIKTKATYTYD